MTFNDDVIAMDNGYAKKLISFIKVKEIKIHIDNIFRIILSINKKNSFFWAWSIPTRSGEK